MNFHIAKQGDTVVIRIHGQLVSGNRLQLKQRVVDELQRGERLFLMDFAETGYIDSAGLGVLVSVSKRIREERGELQLVNLNDDLRTLFELTKLDTLFNLADGPADVRRAPRSVPSPLAPAFEIPSPRPDGEARP